MSDDAGDMGDPAVPPSPPTPPTVPGPEAGEGAAHRWRSVVGVLHEGPGYRVRRPGGRPDWFLVQTLAGCGTFRQGRAVLEAPVGTVTLVRPAGEHDYGTADGHDAWTLAWAHVAPRAEWPALLDWPAPVPAVPGLRQVVLAGTDREAVADALTAAARAWRRATPLAESFALNHLERALLLVAAARRTVVPSDPRVERVLEFVDAHLAGDLSVRVLAGVAGMSPSWFARSFAEHVGSPPQRYVERQRMAVATGLLDATDRPVASVARAVGFTDPLYFSTRFRVVVGSSPSAYRDRHG